MGLKHSILGLLHYKPMHGYRLKEHLERNFGHMWSINFGQIYPNLKKMHNDGLITMEEEICQGEKGPPRKRYSITDKGRKEFQQWLLSSPEGGMLLRDPFLMRFVFFGFGDDRRALAMVEEQIVNYEKQLARRYTNLQRWEHTGKYVRLVADLGVRMNEMYLAWLKEVQTELAEPDQNRAGAAEEEAPVR